MSSCRGANCNMTDRQHSNMIYTAHTDWQTFDLFYSWVLHNPVWCLIQCLFPPQPSFLFLWWLYLKLAKSFDFLGSKFFCYGRNCAITMIQAIQYIAQGYRLTRRGTEGLGRVFIFPPNFYVFIFPLTSMGLCIYLSKQPGLWDNFILSNKVGPYG